MNLYYYGMRAKGCAIGAQPIKDFYERHYDDTKKYYDIISYTRQLSEEEIKYYELEFIKEEEVDEDRMYTTITIDW